MSIMQSSKLFPVAAVRAASREMWLAGLGATVVSRNWARKDAGDAFRKLVREGAVVESRAIRSVGQRVEPSVTHASALLRQARATVRNATESYAGTALALVRASLPRVLPTLKLAIVRRTPTAVAPSSPRRAASTGKPRAAKTVRRVAKAAAAVKTARRTTRQATRRTSTR